MNCQKKHNFATANSKNEFDSLITNSNELFNWNLSLCLEELRTLFRDLQEITKENFLILSNHITNMLIIIEKIVRCYKPMTPTGSIKSRSNKSSGDNDKSNISGKYYNRFVFLNIFLITFFLIYLII